MTRFFQTKLFLFVSLSVALFLGWAVWNQPVASLLIFVAFIPFFAGLKSIQKREGRKLFILTVYFLIFKLLWLFMQVYWLKEVTYDTFFAGIIVHTICFLLIQLPSIIAFSKRSDDSPFYLFICCWILYEYAAQSISILSPFYILGVSLGEYTGLIQNYSVIGIEGGSLWILLVNFFLFKLVGSVVDQRVRKQYLYTALSVVFVPVIITAVQALFAGNPDKKVSVAALHTDFNPVNEYYALHPNVIIDSLWRLSAGIDEKTEVLLWPETAITNMGWVQELYRNPNVDSLKTRLEKYPRLNLIFGGNIHTIPTDPTDQRLNYSRQYDFYFYVHNAAFTLSSDSHITFRSKEIFVPFQEEVPYVQTFPSLKKLITVVGNPNFYSEYENDIDVHETSSGVPYIPLLCYEICYPLFTANVSRDAGFIAVLGNEHWNSSRKGSEIYFNALKTIAIQNAVPIVKSSNNGISVICDASGRVIAQRSFNDTGLLKGVINAKGKNAFYSYISGYTYLLSPVLLLYFLFRKKKMKID